MHAKPPERWNPKPQKGAIWDGRRQEIVSYIKNETSTNKELVEVGCYAKKSNLWYHRECRLLEIR